MIKTECMVLGELETNCFFVKDDEAGVSFVVDPAEYSDVLEKKINGFGAEKLKYILLTHGHFDHIGGAAALKRRYPDAKIVIGRKESEFTNNDKLNLSKFFGSAVEHFSADLLVEENSELDFGENKIKVIETPGHTKGGVCYILKANIFTGDTIMRQTTGRMDFPTGNSREMFESASKIASLEGDYNLYCGHGRNSTLEFERSHNIAMGSFYDNLY